MKRYLKEMKNWIDESKKGDIQGFIAISIDKKETVCCRAECTTRQFITMLAMTCEENPSFKALLQAFAKCLNEGGTQ